MHVNSETRMLITGANGGIGAAIARAAHRAGAKLILAGRRADALAPLAAELGARVVISDLSNRLALDQLHAEVGDVDVAVLNAGISGTGLIGELNASDIDRVLDVNLRAPMLSAQHFSRGMVKRGTGHIVFVSSIAGKVAARRSGLYSATKFGLRAFALGLREDLEGTGVGVSTIFPGFIRDAGMFAKSGVVVSPMVGTRSPEDCARALLSCIENNTSEVDVAAPLQRFGGYLFPLSPAFTGWLLRKGGGEEIADQISASKKPRVS